jgi:hypothetical protein
LPQAVPGETEILLRAMENVYGLFGRGPAGATRPSTGNWASIYTGAAVSNGSAVATNTA